MDQDECDDGMCSDMDDRVSETDSKKEGSRGTSRGSSSEGKSHGNSSKPRRYIFVGMTLYITLHRLKFKNNLLLCLCFD